MKINYKIKKVKFLQLVGKEIIITDILREDIPLLGKYLKESGYTWGGKDINLFLERPNYSPKVEYFLTRKKELLYSTDPRSKDNSPYNTYKQYTFKQLFNEDSI